MIFQGKKGLYGVLNMTEKKLGILIGTGLLIATMAVILFIADNIHTILERAAIMSLKPIKMGIDKRLLYEDVDINGIDTDIYQCQLLRINCPVMLLLHGGYLQGGKKTNHKHLAGILVRLGYTVAVPRVPTAPGMVSSLFMSEKAIRKRQYPRQKEILSKIIPWLNSHASRYNSRAEKVSVTAIDASGFAALEYLFETGGKDLAAIAILNPIVDLDISDNDFRKRYIEPAFSEKYSLSKKIRKVSTPVLLVEAEFSPDFLKNRVMPFVSEMLARGNNVTHVVAEKSSLQSLVFRLGRRNDRATLALQNFFIEQAQRLPGQ